MTSVSCRAEVSSAAPLAPPDPGAVVSRTGSSRIGSARGALRRDGGVLGREAGRRIRYAPEVSRSAVSTCGMIRYTFPQPRVITKSPSRAICAVWSAAACQSGT